MPTKSKLRTYADEIVRPKGEVKVNIEYKYQSLCILVIVTENRSNLLGRDVLKILRLNWFELFNICNTSEISAAFENESLKKIFSGYKEIFKPVLGTFKRAEITLHMDPDAKLRFCRARPVPYAVKGRFEKELEHLVSEGI